MGKRLQKSLLVLSALCAFSIVHTGDAHALSSAETRRDSAAAAHIMVAQAPLIGAADELKALVEKRKFDKFAGIELDVPGNKVLLYWKGPLPTDIDKKVHELSARVDIVPMPARYSKAEMDKRAEEIMHDKKRFGHIHRVTAKTNGSGLEVAFADGNKKAKNTYAIDTEEVVEAEAPVPLSRRDDSPYYSGGGRLTHLTNPNYEDVGCSMGFATYKILSGGTAWFSVPYMLTAEHCDNDSPLGTPYYSGAESMGTSAMERTDLDSLAIHGNSAGRVYDGGVGDDTEFKKPVAGKANNYVGGYVCSSGSFSGVHCGIQITQVNVSARSSGSDDITTNLVVGKSIYGTAAIVVGNGDSGGPVFTLDTDPSKVLGSGIISAGSGYAPCVATYDSTRCYDTIYFVDLSAVLSAHKLQLKTASTLYDDPQLVSLESRNFPGYYMRHRNYLGELSTAPWYDAEARRETSFWLRRGLAGTATVSIGAFAPGNHYLRHEFQRIKLAQPNGTPLFYNDASFTLVGGLAGTDTVSFRSYNYPSYFLRHRNFALYAEPGNLADSLYRNDASWRIVDPMVYHD